MGLREKSWRVLQHLGVCLRAAGMLCCLLTLNVTLRVLRFISPALVRKLLLKMGEKISMTHNPRFRYEDWGPTFLSAVFIKEVAGRWCSASGAAPDPPSCSNLTSSSGSSRTFGTWRTFWSSTSQRRMPQVSGNDVNQQQKS
uniref:Iodothyronine deiodinase n=1 Tax=Oryzias latipes TaxID=8090 RepID=A0A3P9JU82_ORYLA